MKSKKPWLILPVEIKVREFDAKILLSCFAVNRGYNVLFGHHKPISNLLNKLPKGVYLDKSMAYRKTKHIKRCKKHGYYFISIDEEASGCHVKKQYQHARFSNENFEIVDAVFTWGDFEQEVILEAYPHVQSKLHNTGNPRIDLWGSKFKKLYDEKAQLLRKKYGKYIFFPSNFGSSININGKEFLIKQAQENQWFRDDNDRKQYINRIEHSDNCIKKYSELIPLIAKTFPDCNLIIRPHPVEDETFWENLAAPFSNIHVLYEGVATPYILGAACMLHHGCTTTYEAFLFNTPLIAYLPDYDERFDKWPGNKLSQKAHNKNDVIKELEQILNNKYSIPSEAGKIARYNWNNYKKWNACDEMINVFDKFPLPKVSINELNLLKLKLSDKRKQSLEAIKNFIKRILKKNKKKNALIFSSKYKKRKWPGSSLEEAKNILSFYASQNNDFAKIKIKKIVKDLYMLYQ